MASSKEVALERCPGFTQELTVALGALRSGGAVVYPTETVYALGVRAYGRDALQRLVQLKVRAIGKPISVLVSDRSMLAELVQEIPPPAERLMDHFWPGPLTLALPARPSVSEVLTGGTGTIGVRISSHPVAHELVTRLGEPLTTPSANPAGERPPTTVAAAEAYFGQQVAYYLDWGATAGEPTSTVAIVTKDVVRLVRHGAIGRDALAVVAGVPVTG
ncbi:Putative threonylcarbamoyl-AMP synthase [bacterium HR30]|nr:Putative threonylcarbamoyl-AMP synthase [bacterium HR30]